MTTAAALALSSVEAYWGTGHLLGKPILNLVYPHSVSRRAQDLLQS